MRRVAASAAEPADPHLHPDRPPGVGEIAEGRPRNAPTGRRGACDGTAPRGGAVHAERVDGGIKR